MKLTDYIARMEWNTLISVVESIQPGSCPTTIQDFAYQLVESVRDASDEPSKVYYAHKRYIIACWAERN